LLSRTGTRSGCVSARGAFDMVGNLAEWVADWLPLATGCQEWGAGFSDDLMCVVGASTTATAPGALVRGGYYFFLGTFAGPLTVGTEEPFNAFHFIGFRCAR
jgi:formylglycine-generating enzyme required for sulfatase activity